MLLLAGCSAAADDGSVNPPALPSGTSTPTSEHGGGSPAAVATATGYESNAPNPLRVRIPAIGVDAPVGALDLDAEGALEVPTDYDATGWYEPGLDELTPGDEVFVDRADGSSVRFLVRAIESYLKDEFPTVRVYDPTENAQLRLITCGGEFDDTERSYLGNEPYS